MSDTENQVDDPGVPRGRKRERNVTQWAQNVAKKKRNSGEAYVSRATGRHIPARSVGPPCKDGCLSKITMPIVQKMHEAFWAIGDFGLQNSYIQKCVQRKPVKRPRSKKQGPDDSESRRSFTNVYSVTYAKVTHVICLRGFLSVFSISEKRVRNALAAVSPTGTPRGDMRGRHPCPRKIAQEAVNRVLQHIHSFPTVSSHYTRAKSPNMRYLGGNLNIKRIYRLYLLWMEENYSDEGRVKLSFYRLKFRNLNLGFQPPMTDTCSRCDHLKVALGAALDETSRKSLQKQLDEHVAMAKAGQTKMKRLGMTADDNTHVICLDLQQTLPLPRLSTSVAYYQKKLWMYNLCIHDLKKKKSEFFVWDEVVGGRGSSDIASCILKWVNHAWDSGERFTKLQIVSDNCGGQNKNINIILMYLREIHSGRLTEIEHYYLVPGHSYMACDRAFGNIEKAVRVSGDIYDFRGYCSAIRASTVVPQKVTVMRQRDIMNLDVLQESITVRRPKAPYSFIEARKFVIKSTFKSGYFLAMDYDGHLGSVRLQKGTATRNVTFNLSLVDLPLKYDGIRRLKPGKVEALKTLLDYIPPARSQYLNFIINGQDNLDASDEEEEDVDNDLDDNLEYCHVGEVEGGEAQSSTSSQ